MGELASLQKPSLRRSRLVSKHGAERERPRRDPWRTWTPSMKNMDPQQSLARGPRGGHSWSGAALGARPACHGVKSWRRRRGRGCGAAGPDSTRAAAQRGRVGTPCSGTVPPPRLWFQQYITPARPPASSARTATASRSAGPATATPTARTALTRTPPIAVTRAARGGGSATGWEGFLQTC